MIGAGVTVNLTGGRPTGGAVAKRLAEGTAWRMKHKAHPKRSKGDALRQSQPNQLNSSKAWHRDRIAHRGQRVQGMRGTDYPDPNRKEFLLLLKEVFKGRGIPKC